MLHELEKRLRSVGLILKRISIARGSKSIEKFIAIIDPEIDLEEIRPYDSVTLSVLALIFTKIGEKQEISISSLLDDLYALLGDKDKAEQFLQKALTRLERDDIIDIDLRKGIILLTELGRALVPPPDLIDKIIINSLAQEKTGERGES